MAGFDLRTVQELMGHKTLVMTLRYSHLSPGHQLDAVQRLNPAADTMRTDTTETASEAIGAAGWGSGRPTGRFEWRRAESNRGPRDYETLALAN